MDLAGKKVLITGGARRVGRAIAEAFAAKNAEILIHYRSSKNEARSLAHELFERFGCQARLYPADLSKIREVNRLSKKVIRDVGAIDILVNNASLFYPTRFEKVKEKDWDSFLSVHVKAPFFLAQGFAPAMKKKGAGRIINIADWSGLRPYRDYLPYCVSKGAMVTMTQALAKSLAPEILVTAVCPGAILPPAGLKRREKENAAKKTLVGHWGEPTDIARMVVFLAEQDFVTGSSHLVDGGEFLRG